MEKQDWKDKQIDKDLLVEGNKVYGPEFCCFLRQSVNNFIVDRRNKRGKYKIGVYFDKIKGKFKSQCNDGSGNKVSLGYYETEDEAHKAWRTYKAKMAQKIASEETDHRIINALLVRYK